ncbi:MAG: iron ABC transporter substrate-binding protein [Acidimicrobiales bacterium]
MRRLAALLFIPLLATALASCSSGDEGITLYSGRAEVQVKPILEEFTKATGIKVKARYGASAELAAQIAEEGGRTRADVFWAQDAGALGSVDRHGMFGPVPAEALASVDPRFRADDGNWIGVSGRARVIVYNSRKLQASDLPTSVFQLTDPKWKGRIGIAPTNGSFQAFVTAMTIQAGDSRTQEWLQGIKANEPRTYEDNALIVKAANDGQVDVGLVNHYYLFQLGAEIGQDKLVARNHFTAAGDPGSLVNVAGVGILKASRKAADAGRLVQYLLTPETQKHFAERNYEYPLVDGVPPVNGLVPLDQVHGPDLDLSALGDLEHTLGLLRQVGLL